MKKIILILLMLCLTGCQQKDVQITVNSLQNIETHAYLSYNNEQLLVKLTNYTNNSKSLVVKASLDYKDDNYDEELEWKDLGKDETTVLFLNLDVYEKEDLRSIIIDVLESDEKFDFEERDVLNNLTTSYQVFDDLTVDVTLNNQIKSDIDEVLANVVFFKDNIPVYATKIDALEFDESFTAAIDYPKDKGNAISCDDISVYIEDVIIDFDIEDEKNTIESSDE